MLYSAHSVLNFTLPTEEYRNLLGKIEAIEKIKATADQRLRQVTRLSVASLSLNNPYVRIVNREDT